LRATWVWKAGGRAVGVEVAVGRDRSKRIIRADREVIVSSGAIGSPRRLASNSAAVNGVA